MRLTDTSHVNEISLTNRTSIILLLDKIFYACEYRDFIFLQWMLALNFNVLKPVSKLVSSILFLYYLS